MLIFPFQEKQNADIPDTDPSGLHPNAFHMAPFPNAANFSLPQRAYSNSPAAPSPPFNQDSPGPYQPPSYPSSFPPGSDFPSGSERRQSLNSFESGYSGSDDKDKKLCTFEGCNKRFKDLKSHQLTHQSERPEKCPIKGCEYAKKGFSRKYDKNRHTLTHFKGLMTCGFCAGVGTPAEKSFNRADVFKRHLCSVHGVEQNPPNGRKNKHNSPGPLDTDYPGFQPGATGDCSTCPVKFRHPQDFCNHLDDCVLRVVQKSDPAEAINAKNLGEVEDDDEVLATLYKNNVPAVNEAAASNEELDAEGEDEQMNDDPAVYDRSELRALGVKTSAPLIKVHANPTNGVQKSKGMTHSRGGVARPSFYSKKGRKNRQDFPSSWGYHPDQMTTKKRSSVYFDGPRRLAKDDMMLSTEHEVRIQLANGGEVTDLDVQVMRRAMGFHNMSPEEKGLWVSDDPTAGDLKTMQDQQLQEATAANTNARSCTPTLGLHDHGAGPSLQYHHGFL